MSRKREGATGVTYGNHGRGSEGGHERDEEAQPAAVEREHVGPRKADHGEHRRLVLRINGQRELGELGAICLSHTSQQAGQELI